MLEMVERKKKTVKCRLCKGEFFEGELTAGKCPQCAKLWSEWQNGRKKTPEEIERYGSGRVHYVIPSYKRVYSVYQFDWEKYASIYKKIQTLSFKYGKHIFDKTNPYKVLERCYIEENGEKVELGDQKHIFRLKTLQNLYTLIAIELKEHYNLLMSDDVLNYLFKRTKIRFYPFENQAELLSPEKQTIKTRLLIHIQLLRLLRKGLDLEEITEIINAKFNL
jgi:hypothetical protein